MENKTQKDKNTKFDFNKHVELTFMRCSIFVRVFAY